MDNDSVFTCPHCQSKNTRFMTTVLISAPTSLYHNLRKTDFRRADVTIWDANWRGADIICADCGSLIKEGITNE